MVHGLPELLGKHLLFTLVTCDRSGRVTAERQLYGTVEERGDNQPILHVHGSEERVPLPPLYDEYEKAGPDTLAMLAGERIRDIDYTLTCVKTLQ